MHSPDPPATHDDALPPGCSVVVNMASGTQTITFPDGRVVTRSNDGSSQDDAAHPSAPAEERTEHAEHVEHAPQEDDHTMREELIHLYASSISPELWKPSIPAIVLHMCRNEAAYTGRTTRGKGAAALVMVWTTLWQLLVTFSQTPRAGIFSIDQIARLARVSRDSLVGDHGYLQRLVDLGVLNREQVPYPGKTGYRFSYAIDMAQLERKTHELLPEIATEIGVTDPRMHQSYLQRERDFPYSLDTLLPHVGMSMPAMSMPARTDVDVRGTVQPDMPADEADIAQHITDLIRQTIPRYGDQQHGTLPTMPVLRDIVHDAIQEIIPHIVRETVQLLRETLGITVTDTDTITDTSAAPEPTPPPVVLSVETMPPVPLDADGDPLPMLSAPVLTLYRDLTGRHDAGDTHRLMNIAGMFDKAAGGFGMYWLGRAILMADQCLTPGGKVITFAYVRSILQRWATENSWGSDGGGTWKESNAEGNVEHGACRIGQATDVQATDVQATEHPPQSPPSMLHTPGETTPMAIYREVTGYLHPLPPHKVALIEQVTHPRIWRDTCSFWVSATNDQGKPKKCYDPANIEGLYDRYCQRMQQRRVCNLDILNLPLEPRLRFLQRFDAAPTPDEKEAIIAEARAYRATLPPAPPEPPDLPRPTIPD